VIRRLLWVLIGAAAGVTGYRRLSRMLRLFGPDPRGSRRSPSGAQRGYQGVASFARDVRDGMDLYASRQADPLRPARPAAAGWAAPPASPSYPSTDDTKDGR
jgi:hypothetical protein